MVRTSAEERLPLDGQSQSFASEDIKNQAPAINGSITPTSSLLSSNASILQTPNPESNWKYHQATVESDHSTSIASGIRARNRYLIAQDGSDHEVDWQNCVMSGGLIDTPLLISSPPSIDHVYDCGEAENIFDGRPDDNIISLSANFIIPNLLGRWHDASAFILGYRLRFSRPVARRKSPNLVLAIETPFPLSFRPVVPILVHRTGIKYNHTSGYHTEEFNWQLKRVYHSFAPRDGDGSIPEENEEPIDEIAQRPRDMLAQQNIFYERLLEKEGILASSVLEHLNDANIKHESRNARGSMTCIDYMTSTDIPCLTSTSWGSDKPPVYWDQMRHTPKEDFFQLLRQPVPENIHTRLIVVEDLTLETIYQLGSRFNISPEFFEEHLVNSGYREARNGPYQDLPPESWSTQNIVKDYRSIKWYRPAILRGDVPPFSSRSEEDLLKTGFLEYPTGDRHREIYRMETNIFRPKWELATDPQSALEETRICGWEERASIWTRILGESRVVVLLLDPLPTLAFGGYRRENESPSISEVGQSEKSQVSVANAAEEARLGLRNPHRKSRPPPKIPTRFEKLNLKFLRWLRRKGIVEVKEGVVIEEAVENRRTAKVFQKYNSVQIIQQICTRADINSLYQHAFTSATNLEQFGEKITTTRSTKADFLDWLNSSKFNGKPIGSSFGAAAPLFELITADTAAFCRIIRKALNQIGEDIVDESKLEEDLFLWRNLIGRCQRELPELQKSIIQFRDLLQDARRRLEIRNLLTEIEELKDEVSKATASLTSNMQLLDSKRSIQEAQSVTKLTELAFIFIPLSFSAGIFSMQVDVLSNPAPLWAFFTFAVSAVFLSYFVRLMIRSHNIVRMRSRTLESINIYAKGLKVPFRKGQPIPTGLFLSWVLYKSSQLPGYLISSAGTGFGNLWAVFGFYTASFVMICVLAAAPLTILLTRNNVGAPSKIGFSIMIVIVSSLIVIIPYWRSSTPEFRSRLPALIAAGFKMMFASSLLWTVVLWGVGIATACTPLVVIWTRDLAIGIKAAVTVVLVVMIIVVILSMLISRFISLARMADDFDDSDDDTISLVSD